MKMNFAKTGWLVLGLAAVMLGSGGCVVSRTCERALSVGVTEYYADASEIKDNVIYEYQGEFFMFAGEVGCQRRPAWLGFAAPLAGCFKEKKISVGRSETYVLLKLSSAMKGFLLGEEDAERDDRDEGLSGWGGDSLWSGVEVVERMPSDWKNEARVYPVVEWVMPPMILEIDGYTEYVVGSVPVRTERTAASWGMLPLAAVGLAWDIPATVAMSVVFDFVVVPAALVYLCFPHEESLHTVRVKSEIMQ